MSLNNFKTNLLGEKLQITLQLQIKMNYLKNNLTKKAMGYCKTQHKYKKNMINYNK